MTLFDFGSPDYGTLDLGVHPEGTGSITPTLISRLR